MDQFPYLECLIRNFKSWTSSWKEM